MMSGNTWNQWLTFARALNFRVLEESSGIYMYWSLLDGTHHGKLFRRQRLLTGHLRKLAVGYLQMGCVIRLDARYAFASGDHSLMRYEMGRKQPLPSDGARAAHRLHHTLAKRRLAVRSTLDLQRALPDVKALMDMDQGEWYPKFAGEELARQSARQLADVVQPPTSHSSRSRL